MEINASPLCRIQLGKECEFGKKSQFADAWACARNADFRDIFSKQPLKARVGETRLLMQPMRGPLLSIKVIFMEI